METVSWTACPACECCVNSKNLAQTGVRLALARGLGEVRELERREFGDWAVREVHSTVHAAVKALQRMSELG